MGMTDGYREPYEAFETMWQDFAGVRNVVGCSSGTAALHLALEALDLPSGSEVIVPDYAMIACARAVTLAGLVPVFVDVGPDLNILTKAVGTTIRPKTFAVMAVHTFGRRCNMDAIHSIADDYNISVVEDLAEAHGFAPHPATDAACWSFYKNKIVAGEEGGAVSFPSEESAAKARCLRCLGFTPEHDYTHRPRGHNYRLSNLHAGAIVKSLCRYESNVGLRRMRETLLDAQCPSGWRMPPRQAPWVYDVRIPGISRHLQGVIVERLRQERLPVRFGFKPLSMQEEYQYARRFLAGESYRAASEVIYFPLDHDWTEEEARRAFQVMWDVVA